MEILKAHEIQIIIDTAYEAVLRSKVGPLTVTDPSGNVIHGPDGQPILRVLAMNTFLCVLSSIIPKTITGEIDPTGGIE
ncbi:MAG: hypothetical protein [Siphoviridae sp. ctCJE6]|nr:MAG: hypothetical protein [Siphoviridae sp. ctCJE6]